MESFDIGTILGAAHPLKRLLTRPPVRRQIVERDTRMALAG